MAAKGQGMLWSGGDDYRAHARVAIYGVLFGKNEMESKAVGNLHSLLSHGVPQFPHWV